jgi:hypothetical protein
MKAPITAGLDLMEQQPLHTVIKRGSVWRLTPVLALTAATILWLGWQFWAMHKEMERFRTHDHRLVELAGEIVRLDEVLTMSARMAGTASRD